MSYESRNPFNALWDMNVVCYQCNGCGHKSFKCRKNKLVPYNNFKDLSLNKNVKCYNCQEFGHIERLCKNRKIKPMKTNPDQEPITKLENNIAADQKKDTKPVWVEKEKEKAE